MTRRRRATGSGWWRSGLVALAASFACAPAPRPSDAAIYAMVVEAVGGAVEAPSPIRLHPLLMQRPQGDQTLDQGTYNAFDTTTVVGVIAHHDGMALCTTTRVGSCTVPEGGVAMALSEMQNLGTNGVGVGALVMDGRPGRAPQRYATVRVKPVAGGWEVVAVEWTR